MEILVGIVESNEDNTKSGKLRVSFPALDGRVEIVTFTSPYYRMNSGGMVAIPEDGTQILAFHNENPREGESTFYFHSCVISDMPRETNEGVNEDYVALRGNDTKAKIYETRPPYSSKPVTQMFTNTAGAGLYIHRDFTPSKISNNVTLKSESDSEVTVGALGVQIRNEEGDSIILNGTEGNDFYAARSLNVETMGPQEYKCTNSDINMRIVEGGDINIENNSTGAMSYGPYSEDFTSPEQPGQPYSGNVRLKSRNRNIELVGLGDESVVNIITNKSKIQVDNSTGNITIFAKGDLDMTSEEGNIRLTAPLGEVTVFGGIATNIYSQSQVNLQGGLINHNGVSVQYNAGAPGSHYTNSTLVPSLPVPIPGVVKPVGNDYGDGNGGTI